MEESKSEPSTFMFLKKNPTYSLINPKFDPLFCPLSVHEQRDFHDEVARLVGFPFRAPVEEYMRVAMLFKDLRYMMHAIELGANNIDQWFIWAQGVRNEPLANVLMNFLKIIEVPMRRLPHNSLDTSAEKFLKDVLVKQSRIDKYGRIISLPAREATLADIDSHEQIVLIYANYCAKHHGCKRVAVIMKIYFDYNFFYHKLCEAYTHFGIEKFADMVETSYKRKGTLLVATRPMTMWLK